MALADGVVVDTERQVAYVTAPRRGIDAVDLVGGSPLWTAEAAAKPLIVVGDLLLAQAEASAPGRLDVVSFDVRDGGGGSFAARVDLPDGVGARLFDEPNRTFRVRAGLAGDRVVLSWRATKVGGDELRGYLPGPEEGSIPAGKALERLEGAVELDLGSGSARPFGQAVAAPAALDVLPAARVKDLRGRLFTSADRRHFLASVPSPGEGIRRGYRWTIHDSATGERLGEFAHFTSSAPFVVVSNRLIFVSQPFFERRGDEVVDVPRQLRAVDLASGAELWTKDTLDADFRGTFPP